MKTKSKNRKNNPCDASEACSGVLCELFAHVNHHLAIFRNKFAISKCVVLSRTEPDDVR